MIQTQELLLKKKVHTAEGGTLPEYVSSPYATRTTQRNIIFMLLGIVFGFTLMKGEAVSWFRMQEMFRFESIHMFGIMGVAMAIGMLSIEIIKRRKPTSFSGEKVTIRDNNYDKGNIYGGIIFGIGWGITGLCPGPIFVNIGAGMMTAGVVLLSALMGTYAYGVLKHRLPH